MAKIWRHGAGQPLWLLVASTAGAAVIVTGVVLGLVNFLSAPHPHPVARQVPGWALDWPDHRDSSVPRGVLDRAILAWQDAPISQPPYSGTGTVPPLGSTARQVARMAAAQHVIWYVGQTIDHGQVVAVMFEVPTPDGSQLVTGWATASDVMSGQPAWSAAQSPWVFTTVKAPRPGKPALSIGEYVHGTTSRQGFPDNWMVVLTAPGVGRLGWQETTASGNHQVSSATKNGLVIADTGQVTAAVRLTGIWTAAGNVLTGDVPVGVPGAGPGVPQLAQAQALTPPASFSLADSFTGQGDMTSEDSGFSAAGHQVVVLGLCYGPQPLRIQVNGHVSGTIACDSQQHQLDVRAAALHGPDRAGDYQVMIHVATSNLSSWQVALGTAR